MKYLSSKILILLILSINPVYCQIDNKMSNMKDFQGIWEFIPPTGNYDIDFYSFRVFNDKNMCDITFWKESKKTHIIGNLIYGFENINKKLVKLSDLQNKGTQMYFFEKYPNAPNDSIKYYREAIENCFASFNGIGMDDYESDTDTTQHTPNWIFFNYNGRDYEGWEQCTHLPNYIVQSLLKQNREDWQKVRELLPHDYKIVRVPKTTIYSQPNVLTRMYLLKDDVVEVTEEKGEWLQIKYYIEKKNKDTGRTIEGWIKKSDVE